MDFDGVGAVSGGVVLDFDDSGGEGDGQDLEESDDCLLVGVEGEEELVDCIVYVQLEDGGLHVLVGGRVREDVGETEDSLGPDAWLMALNLAEHLS